MSFNLTIFGPRHYFWRNQKKFRAWFYMPDEHSSGGVGFKALFIHVAFHFGMEKPSEKRKMMWSELKPYVARTDGGVRK